MNDFNKVAYLECQTGIAGDMCLGALVDAGVPLGYLIEKLKGLGFEQDYQLSAQKVHKNGQIATKVEVEVPSEHTFASNDHRHARHLPEIEGAIRGARLPAQAEAWSLQVFRQLAKAEGEVHGIAPERVHFHEVGAVDAIVDIVGTCLGLEWLGIDRLFCSAFPTGGGTVRAAHGELPVPVPAVLKLWEARQVPLYSNGIAKELVTPTGAAIATTLAESFGPPPTMQLERVGLGAGSQDLPLPNLLRLWLGRRPLSEHSHAATDSRNGISDGDVETIAVLETQIDDLSPQAIGYTFETLFAAGALDVFTQAIGMKKSRPGILLTVICPPDQISACEMILFRETTTLGIRHQLQQRRILQREIQGVETPYGPVRVKVARQGGTILNVQPEYEDCAHLARTHQQPWRRIHQMALEHWNQLGEG